MATTVTDRRQLQGQRVRPRDIFGNNWNQNAPIYNAHSTANNTAPLPAATDGMVALPAPTTAPGAPPYTLTPPPAGTPTWRHNPSPVGFRTSPTDVGPRPMPTGAGAPPLRAIAVPQSGNAHWRGSHDNIGYQRLPNGRIMPIPGALPRGDFTGNVARFFGGLVGSGAGNLLVPGVGGLAGSPVGRRIGGEIGNALNRRWRQRNSPRMPDTLTRDEIRGAGGVGSLTGGRASTDPYVQNQIGGYNLGRGMEGTYLDRTITTPGQFRAHQRSNQMSRDMANPSVGAAIPDMPSHIYMGDDMGEGARHALTHAELNSPEMRRARDNSMVASTREAMDRSMERSGSAASGPVTRESMIDRLQRARGIVPTSVEAAGVGRIVPLGGGRFTRVLPPSVNQLPPTSESRAQALLRRYQTAGRIG